MSPIRKQFPFRRHNISVNGDGRSDGLVFDVVLRQYDARAVPANPIQGTEPTWVTLDDAARFAGVGRSTVGRVCAERGIPVQQDGRRKLVPLERVLVATTGKDLGRLRRRLARAAALPDAPPSVREWAESLREIVEPLIDRVLAAEQRASLAEAKLELLVQERNSQR